MKSEQLFRIGTGVQDTPPEKPLDISNNTEQMTIKADFWGARGNERFKLETIALRYRVRLAYARIGSPLNFSKISRISPMPAHGGHFFN
jgi:hypothetical protein